MKTFSEAYVSPFLFEDGIGHVAVVRRRSGGRVEAGIFLLDVWCLGVKNAMFFADSEEEFRMQIMEQLLQDEEEFPLPKPAAHGRKLVEDCVAYARGLGFAPHPDYKKACRVFGGIVAAECRERFVFGSDGKPHYIQGPNEDARRANQIVSILDARCGEDGFNVTLATDEDIEDGECFDEDHVLPEEILHLAESHPKEGADDASPALRQFGDQVFDSSNQFSELIYYSEERPNPAPALLDAIFRKLEAAGESKTAENIEACVPAMLAAASIVSLPDEARESILRELSPSMRDEVLCCLASDVQGIPADSAGLQPVYVGWQVLFADPPGGDHPVFQLLLAYYFTTGESWD